MWQSDMLDVHGLSRYGGNLKVYQILLTSICTYFLHSDSSESLFSFSLQSTRRYCRQILTSTVFKSTIHYATTSTSGNSALSPDSGPSDPDLKTISNSAVVYVTMMLVM